MSRPGCIVRSPISTDLRMYSSGVRLARKIRHSIREWIPAKIPTLSSRHVTTELSTIPKSRSGPATLRS